VLFVASAVAAFQALPGCSEASRAPAPWFVGEYIDPAHPAGTLRLSVSPDGTFALALCEGWAEGADARRNEIGRGSWKSHGDGFELIAADWRATLVTDEVGVSLPGLSDTLSGLRCTATSGQAPVESARLVRFQEFADFVHPPGGSGTEGGL
jgi:hypothetical protein